MEPYLLLLSALLTSAGLALIFEAQSRVLARWQARHGTEELEFRLHLRDAQLLVDGGVIAELAITPEQPDGVLRARSGSGAEVEGRFSRRDGALRGGLWVDGARLAGELERPGEPAALRLLASARIGAAPSTLAVLRRVEEHLHGVERPAPALLEDLTRLADLNEQLQLEELRPELAEVLQRMEAELEVARCCRAQTSA